MADGPSAESAPLDMEQLVADHHQVLYRYAYRLTGAAADAEDLTQQTFLVAQQKLGQVRQVECVRGWLFTVLRNCFLKGRRQQLSQPAIGLDVDTLPATMPAERIDGEQLQAAINELTDEFKTIVLLFYFEHRAYREIADQLGIPLGTVMSRLARAKAHLRRALGEPAAQPALRVDGSDAVTARYERTTIRR